MRALALLLAGCAFDPGAPNLTDVDCPIVVHHVIEPHSPEHCIHIEATGGAVARRLGSEACEEWQTCLTLGPGESAASGGPLTNPGNIRVLNWPCEEIPACPP